MDCKAMHNWYQRSNSEELEINAKLFYVIHKRNISLQEKLQNIQILLEKNPQLDINAQDGNDNWNTALHLAVNKNELEVVNFLLTQGANTAIKNGDGKTSLDLAEERNHVGIIDALKSHISQEEWLRNDFTLGEALDGADCFFDALAQGMSALCVPGGTFNVQSLRQSCCNYARDNQDAIYDSQMGMTWLQAIAENACTGGYATGSSRQADFESYLVKLEAGKDICGRPEIEGRMLCKIYGIKLHLLEKQTADGQDIISPQLTDSSGSRAVTLGESTNLYKDPGVIHLLNEGQAHFVPILPKLLSHKELTEQTAHKPPSKRDSNSHAAAAGKQVLTTVLPPFSGKLSVDKELKLSHDDFKRRIEEFYENKHLSAINQLKATPTFPTPHVLAHFASMAYTDYQRKEPKPPDGWKLLTTASHFGILNGYFGTAYWHPEHQQVVIAHRGTDRVSAFVTDIKGVYLNNYIDQMSSASTFANKVVTVLQEIEQEKCISFELFFTGHSLGGWLAQITNFTTKYLHVEQKGGTFLKRLTRKEYEPLGSSNVRGSHDVRESYHPHTVVFDSPGCKDMLLQMADKLDVRLSGCSIDLQHLDITGYLSAPNRNNTCNSHLGTVYRIFIDLSHMDSLSERTPLYNLATHRMNKIVEAFDPETGQVLRDDKGKLKIQELFGWPVSAGLTGGAEYNHFFVSAKRHNNYHPDVMDTVLSKVPEGYGQIRYQTKAYDECARSLSIFTQDEQEFLELYRWLCPVPEFFKPEDLFSVMNNTDAQQEAEQKLRNFELGNGNVRCPDASTLQVLIPYVKRLVRLFPHIKENIKAKLSSPQIRSWVYQYETRCCYMETIHQSALDFNPGALGLREFLTSDQQIWQLRMIDGDAWTGLTKVYRLFQKRSCVPYYFSEGKYTVLKLKRMVTVNRMINLSTLLASMETPHLLMIACKTNQPINDELRDMFKELFSILKQKKNMKIILTTPSEDSIAAFLQQTARATLGEGLKTTDEQLTWSDLTRSSQRKILEKAVIFQGRKVALNQLTSAESVTNFIPLADLLQETEIIIGEEPALSACSGYNEKHYIDRTFQHNIVIRQDISSDKREGKFADLLASDEQEFKQLCQQNPKSNVHWLVKDKSGELIWQQSQGNLKTLREYIDAQKSHSYGPKDLDKLLDQARYHRAMLIADKAGMGKSTVLTHLSKQIKEKFPAHWLVRIDLNGYTEQLEAQKGKKMDKERVLEFVSKEVLKLESRLEKELFMKDFEGNEPNKVVIMLDGFDEISPNFKETVIDMLQVLKQTSSGQLWVTTRPHLREELEDKLQQLAYTLQPFSEVEQVEFLNKFWLQNLNLETTNQRQLEIYATALIRKLAQSISDKDKEFASITLQTRMLAEAFEEEFISFYRSEKSKPELTNKLDLLGLYGRFIDSKYDIYYREKSKTLAGNMASEQQLERNFKGIQFEHQLLALQALFSEDQVAYLQINYESKFSGEELATIGIVQRNHEGKPQFIHRTFAEYYVADFLINQLTKRTKQHIQVQEFLLNKVLLQTDCHVIRAFLNGLLEKSKPSTEALKEYGEKLDEQWNEGEILSRLIGFVQTALRQAATEDNTRITEFLLGSLKSGEHSNALRNMLLATDVLGRTAWHMAANEGKVNALKEIWECVDEVTPTVTCSLRLLKDTSDETASHWATKRDHTNSLEKPWNSAKEAKIYAEQLKKQMLLAQDLGGKTAWHLAAENCNEEVLDKIWRCAKEVLVNPSELENTLLLGRDRDGRTVLHKAVNGSVAVLNKLWAFAKETQLKPHEFKNKLLLVKDMKGDTVWHAAAERDTLEVLDTLWHWAKDVKLKPDELSTLLLAKDKYDKTAWHTAVERNNLDMLEALCSWAKEAQLKSNELSELLLSKDKYGNTVWHAAAETDNLEVLEALWRSAKEAQLKPKELHELLLAKDKYSNTVWHAAAEAGNLELLEALWCWAKAAQLKPVELSELLLAKDEPGNTVWHTAAERGNLEVLKALWSWAKDAQLKRIELSKFLLTKDGYGNTVWHAAAERGNLEVLEALWSCAKEAQLKPIALSKFLLAKDKYGKTVWHAAAEKDNLEVLKKLWSWAKEAELKSIQLSKFLLAKDEYGNTVWHAAAERGNLEVLEALWRSAKEAELKPNELSELLLAKNKYGNIVWHAAVNRNTLEALETLWSWAKEAQLKPNELSELLLAKDQDGNTAWHKAVKTGNLEALDALWHWAKEAQLKPNDLSELLLAKDKDGNTVWHVAVKRGNLEVLEALWSWANEAHLKPNELSELLVAKNKYGHTVWYAGAETGNLEVLEALRSWAKEAQIKPNELSELLLAKDKYGSTVWHVAVWRGNLEILEALWSWANEAHLKPNELSELLLAKGKYGSMTWHAAVKRGNLEVLQALWRWAKEAQLKPNDLSELLLAKNKFGNTVWHAGAQTDNLEVLEALRSWTKKVKLKPDELSTLLLAKDEHGNTAWHAAAERGNLEALKALWSWAKEAQLKPNDLSEVLLAKNKYGNTVWHVVVRRGNLEMLKALRRRAKEAQLKPNDLSELLLGKDMYGNTVWHAAAKRDTLEALKTLRSWAKEAQLKPNKLSELLLAKNKYGNTVWHAAAKRDTLEALETLWNWAKEVKLKPDELSTLLLAKDKHGNTAWHTAAERGNLEALEALWSWAKEAQLKPNDLSELLLAKNKYGNTAWHAAAETGNLEVLVALWCWAKEVKLKPDEIGTLLLAKDRYGNTMWHIAIKRGNLEMLEALRSWAKEGQLKPSELSELLLAKGQYGNTAWHAAVRRGNLEVLEALWSWAKEAQLIPNELSELLLAKDKNGSTAFHVAAKGDTLEALGTLWSWAKEAQLKPNELSELLLAKNKYGKTVWHAAAKGDTLEALGTLWSWGMEVKLKSDELSTLLLAKDKHGNTAWHAAAERGNLEALEALWIWAKEAQLKPNDLSELLLAKKKYGNTVWYAAAETGNLELLEALQSWAKEAQLKPNELSELLLAKDEHGNTMWHAAAQTGNLEVLEALWSWAKEVKLKPDELSTLLLAKDEDGNTVWHVAVKRGNLDMLEALRSWANEAQLKPNELSELLTSQGQVWQHWHGTQLQRQTI